MNLLPTPHIAYQRGHVRALDGLRGLAIGLVMLYHLFGPAFSFGWMGVDLFFVLSGFLITGILIDTREQTGYLRNFFARRVLRIFPLYYIFLAVVLFGLSGWVDVSWYVEHHWWFWTYLENWKFAVSGWPRQDFLHHFWSLAIEEQFYMFWPFVVLLFTPRKLISVALALIGCAILFRIFGVDWFGMKRLSGYVSTLGRVDALLIGAIIAALIRLNRTMLERIAPWTLLGCAVTIAAILGITRDPGFSNPLFKSIGFTVIDLFFGSVLVFALAPTSARWLNKLLETAPLVFLGKYSYGLYVYHWPVYLLMKAHCFPWLETLGLPSFGVRAINSIATFGIAVLLSLVSFHTIEKHFLKLKRYFVFQGNQPKPVSA